jgi:hypothetical protein
LRLLAFCGGKRDDDARCGITHECLLLELPLRKPTPQAERKSTMPMVE